MKSYDDDILLINNMMSTDTHGDLAFDLDSTYHTCKVIFEVRKTTYKATGNEEYVAF